MMTLELLKEKLSTEKGRTLLAKLYGQAPEIIEKQIDRYVQAVVRYRQFFPHESQKGFYMFSTPGRTEIGGNHTDHNAGRVLAAGVSLDAIAVATPAPDDVIRVYSGRVSRAVCG